MHWMFMPFRRFADFEGRSRRMEYWMFTLFNLLVGMAIAIGAAVLIPVFVGTGANAENAENAGAVVSGILGAVFLLYVLVLFIPSLAVQVRRFHDLDKSGWFVFLGFIPFVGGLIVLIFMCMEGTRGPNRYGEDPKG